jgi:hypothetical protein
MTNNARKNNLDDNQSTHSRNSSLSGNMQKKMTKLSNVKASQPKSTIKRGEGGTIELDLTHAKTSELHEES